MKTIDRSGWAEGTRKLHSDVFSLISAAVSEARSVLSNATIPRLERRIELACALLFRRVITGTEAVALLVQQGFAVEARIQSRSVTEAVFRLGALRKDPRLLGHYAAQGHLAQRRMAQDLLKLRATVEDSLVGTEPTTKDVEEIIANAQKGIDEENDKRGDGATLSELSAYEWAKRGDMLQHFHAQYAGLSMTVHHALQDLEWSHVEKDSDDRPVGIQVGPDPRPAPRPILVDSIFSLYIGAREFCAVVGVEFPKRLELIFNNSVRLARD